MTDSTTSIDNLLSEFLACKTFVVAGSFRSPEKYAFRIFRHLTALGKTVYPVNPHCEKAGDTPCYQDLAQLPVVPEVVSLVTPPSATEKIVRTCRELGIQRVWMQPGAESEAAVRYCRENGILVVYNTCILLQP